MLQVLCLFVFLALILAQDVQVIDTSNVVSVDIEMGTAVKLFLAKADGTESVVVINKFDHIHMIVSALCERIAILDCNGLMDRISLHLFGILYTPVLPHALPEDYNGTRKDIIRHIAKHFPVTDYLEIGCAAANDAFKEATVIFPNAVGVDPNEGGTLKMTSDEFFANNTAMFDLIFVDGLHEANQAFRDIHNALNIVRPGGTVLMHDVNPRNFQIQDKEQVDGGVWTGDVWKAAVALRLRQDIEIVMADVDYGVGVIRKRPNRHPLPAEWVKHLDVNPISMLTYEMYEKDKYTFQRFMTLGDVRAWLAEEAASVNIEQNEL